MRLDGDGGVRQAASRFGSIRQAVGECICDEEIHGIVARAPGGRFCKVVSPSERYPPEWLDNLHSRRKSGHGTTVACPATVATDARRQIRRMLGEFLREAGVLVAVLAPLESLVTHGMLTLKGIVAIVVLAVPCLVFGMVLGLER